MLTINRNLTKTLTKIALALVTADL